LLGVLLKELQSLVTARVRKACKEVRKEGREGRKERRKEVKEGRT
jgi:hypothetical protein